MFEKFSAKRALLPALVFLLTMAAHYAWFVKTGSAPSQSDGACCGSACESSPGVAEYIKTQTYLLGYSVALSLSYASIAIRKFVEQRTNAAKGAALGGVGASAILGFAGCYLTGCCGSPMLGVYIGLLGPTILPFAKPLVAVITTISILLSARSLLKSKSASNDCCSAESSCSVTPVTIEKAN